MKIRAVATNKRETSKQLKIKLRDEMRERQKQEKKEARERERKRKKARPKSKFSFTGENKFAKVERAVERMKKEIGLTNEKVPGIITTTDEKRVEGYRTKRLGFPRYYNQLGVEFPAILGFVQTEFQLGRDIPTD